MLINLRDQRQKEITDTLSDIDPYTKHRTMQAIRLAGTGSWAFPQFDDFLAQDSPSIMMCTGIAGSGKSVLSSQFFDRVSKIRATRRALLWYCDYGDKRTLDPCNLIRNLCQQCLRLVEECLEEILIKAQNVITLAGIEHIQQILAFFSSCLEIVPYDILFLDGLDEMAERDQKVLLRTIYQILGSGTNQTQKFYVSSREDLKHISQTPTQIPWTTITMQETVLASDMEVFVRHLVNDAIVTGALHCGNALLPSQIVQALVQGSKGM